LLASPRGPDKVRATASKRFDCADPGIPTRSTNAACAALRRRGGDSRAAPSDSEIPLMDPAQSPLRTQVICADSAKSLSWPQVMSTHARNAAALATRVIRLADGVVGRDEVLHRPAEVLNGHSEVLYRRGEVAVGHRCLVHRHRAGAVAPRNVTSTGAEASAEPEVRRA